MELREKEKITTWGLVGAAALGIAALSVHAIQKKQESDQLAVAVRDNIRSMNLPGQVDCNFDIGEDRTRCVVDFRQQTVRPELSNCRLEMSCVGGDTSNCKIGIVGDDARATCEKILDEASRRSQK
jgi:hypothetical protein